MPSSAIGRKKRRLSGPVAAVSNKNDGVLPTDMLLEVLLRLPGKDLCRLRLVCRSWRSLTSDPGFAKAHASRHPLVAGIRNGTNQVHLVDLSGNIVRRLHGPEGDVVYDLNTQLDTLCVSAVSAGTGFRSSCVLSSATGEVVAALPYTGGSYFDADDVPDNGLVSDGAWFLNSSPSVLAYVPSTGEHKVLRWTTYYYCPGDDADDAYNMHTCNVMTLDDGGGGRWQARPCPPVGCPLNFKDSVVVIDGVAYFLRNNYGEPDAIFCFDLATEEWRPNALCGPLSSRRDVAGGRKDELEFRHDLESLRLLVLNGCLVAAHHKNGDCSMDLWFLVDMDIDKGLWAKRYSIHCVPRRKAHAYYPPSPLHVLDDGRILIWEADEQDRVLKVYDPRTKSCANLTSMEEYGYVRMHLGSLLCPGLQS